MKVVELLGSSGADVGQQTTDGHTASGLKKADMFAGYRYTQSLLVPEGLDAPADAEASPTGSARREEEGAETDREPLPDPAGCQPQGEEERERAREQAASRRRRMEQEQAIQAQMHRNLMAAAGMHV